MFECKPVYKLDYKGTPEGWCRLGFHFPNGAPFAAMIRMDPSWDASIFFDESTTTKFCVATSKGKAQLLVERWLAGHPPERREFKTKAAQKAALGDDADTLSHSEIVQAIKADITDGDKPPPPAPSEPPLVLVEATEHVIKRMKPDNPRMPSFSVEKVGHYYYREGDYGKDKDDKQRPLKPSWFCAIGGTAAMLRTKADPKWPRKVFLREDKSEIFFLFTTPNGDYLLEALRRTGGGYRRLETTAPKSSTPGGAQAVIKKLAPSLRWDADAFA